MTDNKKICAAFVGNPNCGKTTLFNALTGANLKVANWPGVTVERKEGYADCDGTEVKIIDLPGIYSLTSYSIEEKVSRKCILEEDIDVIINIVDASALERNLYLTMQLLEMGKPVILALNMMDIIEERGLKLDLTKLREELGGITIVPVSARKRTGLHVLGKAITEFEMNMPKKQAMHYTPEIEEQILKVKTLFKLQRKNVSNMRWHAIKILERDEEILAEFPDLGQQNIPDNLEKEIINQKYDCIEKILGECILAREEKSAATDKADKWLTHSIWGIPIFLCIMAAVFFLTFFIGDRIKDIFETGLYLFSGFLYDVLEFVGASEWIISLIVDGIFAGVGGILTFLPNIIILFFALAILEDSGYMARAAYIMDGIMGKAGLSGKAFLPLILGFGCTVPAIMATRSLEKEEDRKRTIFITPYMSCSARLPIYILFAGMFFKKYAAVAAFSMYFTGAAIAIIIALIMGKLKKRENNIQSLLIELPEYKTPNTRTILIYVWEKVKDYLQKAGTTIFLASIIIWFILNYNMQGMTNDIAQSFGAVVGRKLEPILAPAGLGMWQIAVALISGISAKEVVVSSFAVLYGIQNPNTDLGMQQLSGLLNIQGFNAVNAYAFMIFCLLYVPCVATIATVRKETNSWKYTLGMTAFQLILAWLAAVLVYQIGIRIF